MIEFLNSNALGRHMSIPGNVHPVSKAKVIRDGINAGDDTILRGVDEMIQLPSYKNLKFLRTTFLGELKGKFTREEWVAMVDSLNGTPFYEHHHINPLYMVIQLDDFEKLESGVSRHGADFSALKQKLEGLTTGQLYFLIREIETFWQSQVNGKPVELEEFVQQLV